MGGWKRGKLSTYSSPPGSFTLINWSKSWEAFRTMRGLADCPTNISTLLQILTKLLKNTAPQLTEENNSFRTPDCKYYSKTNLIKDFVLFSLFKFVFSYDIFLFSVLFSFLLPISESAFLEFQNFSVENVWLIMFWMSSLIDISIKNPILSYRAELQQEKAARLQVFQLFDT